MNDGILLINKPPEISSFQTLSFVKKVFGTKKIGHCGTLDPFADGLLIACVNQATKIAQYLEGQDKEYIATIQLGIQTDTGDRTGTIVQTMDVPPLSYSILLQVLQSFLGKQTQIPPMYSALKVDGKKLYELARQGKIIERAARSIHIYEIELLNFEEQSLQIRVRCSKGTYIRTLAEDIGKKLNTVAHLIHLTRTKIGEFSLDNAISPNSVVLEDLISIPKALSIFPHYEANREIKDKIYHGMPLKLTLNADIILFVESKEKAIALYQKKEDYYICLRGLWT